MLSDLYAIVEKDIVYVVDKMNVECWGGPILNAHKNVKLTESGGVWRRV